MSLIDEVVDAALGRGSGSDDDKENKEENWEDKWLPRSYPNNTVIAWLVIAAILFVISLFLDDLLSLLFSALCILWFIGYPIASFILRDEEELRPFLFLIGDRLRRPEVDVYNELLEQFKESGLINKKSDPSRWHIDVIAAGEPDIIEIQCREHQLSDFEPVFKKLTPRLDADHYKTTRIANTQFRVEFYKRTAEEQLQDNYNYMDLVYNATDEQFARLASRGV